MTRRSSIKTYDTRAFRDAFMQPERQVDALLKADFGTFFIVKVEELLRLIRLPVPPMRATNHTCIYLTQGEAGMTIGSETYTIQKDELLLVPAGQVFSFQNLDINQGYLCHFHTDILAGKYAGSESKDFEFLSVWGNPRIRLDGQTSQWVEHLFKRLLMDYVQQGIQKLDIIQPYLISLLCEINRAYKPLSSSPLAAAVTINNRFKELLFTHFKTRQRVSDYADLLAITPNHLNKSVKAVSGKSPTKWIDEAIVLEAKVLLCQSHLEISEIAFELGVTDPSYFSRLFKKYVGTTPVAFRKMIEKSYSSPDRS